MTEAYETAPKNSPILVTGATGYVAGWIVKFLLDAGLTVHATVRDPKNVAKVGHLLAMAETSLGAIRLFKADLLESGSHEAAMQGCRIVMHTASPFLSAGKVADPQREFVEPALQGTRDILETVNRVSSVERVVLTSSTVAITDPLAPKKVRTEADWNESADLHKSAYPFSKVLAEREAWKIAGAQDRWKLVVINPGFVVGPATGASQTSASFDIVRSFADGSFPNNAPTYPIGTVDVQDVAEAHLRGAFIPDAEGRNIVFGAEISFADMARMLREEFGDQGRWTFPPDAPPSLSACPPNLDNSKSKTMLGMEYRSLRPAVIGMFNQIVAGNDAGQENCARV